VVLNIFLTLFFKLLKFWGPEKVEKSLPSNPYDHPGEGFEKSRFLEQKFPAFDPGLNN